MPGTPKILVKLYTTLKLRLNKSQLWVEGKTAGDALRGVAQAAGPETMELILDEEGLLRNEFLLTLDSEVLDRRSLDQIELKDGSVLHIFPPISGG
ncbi:MAG: MoaD/ThiS family protein [Elusimicrobia bacterium]|nr:MoaD/ThiS family protein [Elusimicrobiota bacterium]